MTPGQDARNAETRNAGTWQPRAGSPRPRPSFHHSTARPEDWFSNLWFRIILLPHAGREEESMSRSGHELVVNGRTLYYELEGDGPPLLLLHGFTGCGRDFALLGAELLHGYRAVIPDLPGHGRSAVLERRFRHRDVASDVLALLDHLGLERVDAIGLSAGGNVLLHAAGLAPDRIGAMVVVSATPTFPEQARAIMRAYRVDALPAEEQERLSRVHESGPVQIEALARSARGFADDGDDMTLESGDLGRIRARTLFVQGDRDPFYPVELTVGMYRAVRDAQLWVRPGAGHTPVFGPGQPAFVETAARFLADARP